MSEFGAVSLWVDAQTSMSLHVNAHVCRDDILYAYVRLYAGAIGDYCLLQDCNATPNRVHNGEDYLQDNTIQCMEWPAQSKDLNPTDLSHPRTYSIRHLWDALGRRVAALNSPPQTPNMLTTLLLEQWLVLPSELLDCIIDNTTHRCMGCIASRGDHTPYHIKFLYQTDTSTFLILYMCRFLKHHNHLVICFHIIYTYEWYTMTQFY